MPSENPKQLLEYLAEGLVDDPEAVTVEQFEEDDGTIVLELCVGADDYGRVIGRGGRTAHALRTVVKAAAASEGLPRARRHRRLTAADGTRGACAAGSAGRVGRPHGLDGSFYVTGAAAAAAGAGRDRARSPGETREIVRRAGHRAAPDRAPGGHRRPRRRARRCAGSS